MFKIFTIDDFTRTMTGLPNKLPVDEPDVLRNSVYLLALINHVSRDYGLKSINSGFRCENVNKAVKGVKNSLHKKGLAADLSFSSPMHQDSFFCYASTTWKSIADIDVIKYANFIHIEFETFSDLEKVLLYEISLSK